MPDIADGSRPILLQSLPEEMPPNLDVKAKKEGTLFEDGSRLDHSLRSWSGYGALFLALLMYFCGLVAIALFIGFLPSIAPAVKGDAWHIVVAVLVALFSVPTVLVLAVLRSTSAVKKDAEMDSLHAAVGEKLMAWIEKMTSK